MTFQSYNTDDLIKKATVRTSLFGKKRCQIDAPTIEKLRAGEKDIASANLDDKDAKVDTRYAKGESDDADIQREEGEMESFSAEDMANFADEEGFMAIENKTTSEEQATETNELAVNSEQETEETEDSEKEPTLEDTEAAIEDAETSSCAARARQAYIEGFDDENNEQAEETKGDIDSSMDEVDTINAELEAATSGVGVAQANGVNLDTFDGTGSGANSAYSLSMPGSSQEDNQNGTSSSGSTRGNAFSQAANSATANNSQETAHISELAARLKEIGENSQNKTSAAIDDITSNTDANVADGQSAIGGMSQNLSKAIQTGINQGATVASGFVNNTNSETGASNTSNTTQSNTNTNQTSETQSQKQAEVQAKLARMHQNYKG